MTRLEMPRKEIKANTYVRINFLLRLRNSLNGRKILFGQLQVDGEWFQRCTDQLQSGESRRLEKELPDKL